MLWKAAMPSGSPQSPKIFECRQCGECCKGYGGTYLSAADIVKISAYIGVASDTFVSTYCRMSGNRPLLSQRPDGYCVFWDQRICTIHPVKPRMCRQWPYIRNVLKDVENWKAMASMCPGIHADAPAKLIRRRVREELEGSSPKMTGGRRQEESSNRRFR